MNNRAARWIRPQIQAVSAYHVPDARGLIKLDAMENPYPLPESLIEPWLQALRGATLNRYPDPGSPALKARLRRTFAIPADMGLLLGNGSDELIQMILMAVNEPGRVVLAPEPTFSMYRLIATCVGIGYLGVPLREDFSLDKNQLRAAIERHQPAAVFLAYPNNPSGNLFEAGEICALIEAAPGLVVIDEAYAAFCDASFMGRLGEYDNLLVLRTVSKLGLAGLRLGYLIGDEQWLRELDKVRLPYNINALTQISAEFALGHYDTLAAQARRIREDRAWLTHEMQLLDGIKAYPSYANFILFRVPVGRSAAIFQRIRDRGVLIKSMHGSHPALSDCLRVTVGTPEENRAFIDALAAAV